MWRRTRRALKYRLTGKVERNRLATGGAIIALVGGDGAGKSTVVDGLYAWLSKDFEVHRVHMGKPKWSITTIAVRGALKVGRLLRLFPYSRLGPGQLTELDTHTFPGYPWLLREVFTARDRYRAYKRARRFANRAEIVVADRYPLPQLMLMDGLRSNRVVDTTRANRLVRALVRIDERFNRQMLPPDLIITLRVDPELAVRRKPEEEPVSVRARATEVWNVDWADTSALVVNANRSRQEVLAEVKSLIWSEL